MVEYTASVSDRIDSGEGGGSESRGSSSGVWRWGEGMAYTKMRARSVLLTMLYLSKNRGARL